jgi:signal transduction histidine kinase
MSFRVQARTLLQLGAELISSDAIALYELIKNASDAGSPSVDISVVVRLNNWPGNFQSLIAAVELGVETPDALRRELIKQHNPAGTNVVRWLEKVRKAETADELCRLARRANYIRIADTGHGMSLVELRDVYLTVGTPNRLVEKAANTDTGRKIQGEKGLGRLSAMRLGEMLRIETSRVKETHWNLLRIDWKRFGENVDELLSDIEVEPQEGEKKEKASISGTTIRIYDLRAAWDPKRLREYADESLNRITDPFSKKPLFKVNLYFNETQIFAEAMDTDYLKMAHATVTAEYIVEGTASKPSLTLRGSVNYHVSDQVRVNNFNIDDITHLLTTAGVSVSAGWNLGSFSMRGYWFNRQALRQVKPNGPLIVKWVNAWAGGLMLFRDGFRVHPYGGPDDDWLDLDRKALASGGYKMNRRQFVGKVDIKSADNPKLIDQTNREGLRDCPEKDALTALLKHILEVQMRAFMNEIEKERRRALDLNIEELTARAAEERDKLEKNFTLLKRKHEVVLQEKEIIRAMDQAIEELETVLARANEAADEANGAREQLVHLAGLGLMVEMLAHELNRSTQYALGALAEVQHQSNPAYDSALQTLELQLKTLSKRLRSLDPATTSGRNRKETFDLVQLVHDIAAGHKAEFERHHIKCRITPSESSTSINVKMVKGMIVQVLENLLSNSLYWIKQHSKVKDNYHPIIEIEIDRDEGELRITDNGPGVLESIKPRLFTPFFTTKPPGHGKGLGLFIARDIANYHDCKLTLAEEQRIASGRYNTFVLSGLPVIRR